MNNKRVFSVNMFWNTFKSMRMIAMLASVIIIIIGVFPIASQTMETEMYVDSGMVELETRATIVNAVSTHSYVVIAVIITALLLSLNVWKFLNKRSSSDLYHSIPHTRSCVFISKGAAVVAWITIMTMAAYIALALAYVFGSKYNIVDYFILFRLHLSALICGLLVFGAVSLACAVTGNVFNNMVVTGIVLFFPRLMWYIMASAVSSMVEIVPLERAIPFINSTQNMVVGVAGAILENGYGLQKVLISVESNCYTIILAIIYMVAALLLFKVRKSESAEIGAYGKKTGFIIGCLISMLIATIGTTNLLVNLRLDTEATDIQLMAYVYAAFSMFLLSFVGVFSYEFFSSKIHVKYKLKKSIIPTVAGWGVAVIMAGVAFVTTEATLNYTPDKGDIKYVNISNNSAYDYDTVYYYDDIANRVELYDERIIEIVSDALKNNIERLQDGTYRNFERGGFEMHNGQLIDEREYVKYSVCINDGLMSSYRDIYFSVKQYEDICERMYQIKEYKDAFYDLPAFDDAVIHVYSEYINFSDEMYKDFYNTFLEELKTIEFENYYKVIKGEMYGISSVSLNIDFARNNLVYNLHLRINNEAFPKTMTKYYEYCNQSAVKNKDEIDRTIEILNECINKREASGLSKEDVTIVFYVPQDGEYDYEKSYVFNTATKAGSLSDDSVAQVLIPAVIDKIKSDEKIDLSQKNKMFVRVNYRDELKHKNMVRIIQLDGDLAVNWEAFSKEQQ